MGTRDMFAMQRTRASLVSPPRLKHCQYLLNARRRGQQQVLSVERHPGKGVILLCSRPILQNSRPLHAPSRQRPDLSDPLAVALSPLQTGSANDHSSGSLDLRPSICQFPVQLLTGFSTFLQFLKLLYTLHIHRDVLDIPCRDFFSCATSFSSLAVSSRRFAISCPCLRLFTRQERKAYQVHQPAAKAPSDPQSHVKLQFHGQRSHSCHLPQCNEREPHPWRRYHPSSSNSSNSNSNSTDISLAPLQDHFV